MQARRNADDPLVRQAAAAGAFVHTRLPMKTPNEPSQSLAPTGTLRAAINFGNPVLAQRDGVTGEPRGVSVDLANELGRRTNLPVRFVTFDAAGKVFDALQSDAWDVAFLAIDPARATQMLFTPPYVLIEGGYMVRNDSPLQRIDDVDRPNVRITVANKSAYDLYLTRTLTHAQIVGAPTGEQAIELFLRDGYDVAAGVRIPLVRFAAQHRDVRVLEGRFMVIEQAMATPGGREVALKYLSSFIEEMKENGFIARALERSGQFDAKVAPLARQATR